MKNVYDKIEKLYNKEDTTEPTWAKELKQEVREIKLLLKNMQSPKRAKRKSKDYFTFVNILRERLKADTTKEVYPEVHYKGRRIGANIKGFLYDKATTKSLPASEAFTLYEYFYAKKEQIDSFIIVT